MKRALGVFLATTLFLSVVPVVSAVPGNTCVTIYENGGSNSPDSWTKCAPNWNPPATNNLDLYTTGLVNGCNRTWPNGPGSTWNDCVSSFRITGLAPNKRLKFFVDSGYSGFVITCKHADGTTTGTFAGVGYNDAASSWRVESGDC